MNDFVIVGKEKIYLNFEEQVGKKGIPFRLSGTRMVLDKPAKWIDKVEKRHVVHCFKYLDGSGYFSLEFDYNDKFFSKV